jgi:hypothetical protein
MPRSVDEAMAEDRPEKKTIRGIWLDEIEEHNSMTPPDAVPLYLTLPGARGGDIAALIEHDLLERTETGAIADAESMRIVAVEGSPVAVVELQSRYPGLKVLEQPLHGLLKSAGPFQFPQGDERTFCRAQVVNLDFDKPLQAKVEQGQLTFPALALVAKLAKLHGADPQVDWTLCLTLCAYLEGWSEEVDRMACEFLAANFKADQEFSELAKGLLGEELHELIFNTPAAVAIRERCPEDQQRFLMVLVPKRIARDIHADGWQVETVENLRYGGTADRAHMVTWVLRMTWDERATTAPAALYQEALRGSMRRLGRIDPEGELCRD